MKHSTAQKTLLTGARQTMLSWIKVIENFDDVPKAYQSAVNHLLVDEQEFPYTLLAPPISGSRFPLAEKLLLWLGETLYILEQKLGQVHIVGYPKHLIGHLEKGSVLLYSWFTVYGQSTNGDIVSSTVPYNTATYRHIQPILNKLRSLSVNSLHQKREFPEFDYLSSLNFKFFNFARNSVKGDELIISSLWQPEISQSIFPLFKRAFKRLIASAHLTILTEQEIIFIEDDHRSIEMKGKRYGGIWQYIPRKNIISTSINKGKNGFINLVIQVSPATTIKRIFDSGLQNQVMQLKAEMEKGLKQ